jgi:hypothetical protein
MAEGEMGMDNIEAILANERFNTSIGRDILPEAEVFVQGEVGVWAKSPLLGNRQKGVCRFLRRSAADKRCINTLLNESRSKIAGVFCRPGPFPIVEKLQNLHFFLSKFEPLGYDLYTVFLFSYQRILLCRLAQIRM